MRRIWIWMAGALLLAGPALAQQTYELQPPRTVNEEPSLLWPWLYGLTFLVGCLVVAFKPAKRANLQ